MAPQPPNQPPNNQPAQDPRLAQYRAQGAQPMGMSGMPMGGAPGMAQQAPNFRGMGAPPNQSQMAGARMPAPWMQNQPPAAQPPANPNTQSQIATASPNISPTPTSPQSDARMPAPWNRPQAQGQGMSPASRMQSQGPQRMGRPANGGDAGASMKPNAEPDQNKTY